jgi:hypothetical protein
LQN